MSQAFIVKRGGGNFVLITFTNYSNGRIPVTAGSIYNFTGTEVVAASSITLNLSTPVNGYIKLVEGVI